MGLLFRIAGRNHLWVPHFSTFMGAETETPDGKTNDTRIVVARMAAC